MTSGNSTDYHLIGIGGVGMSALAQLLLDLGYRVSGSDRLLDHGDETDVLARLRAQGVELSAQNGTAAANARCVVASSAIEEDNPDLCAARRLGIERLHRATALERLVPDGRLIAVAGTSGKSTTTALLGALLAAAGEDPVVINGAGVRGWGTNGRVASIRPGRGRWWIAEVDESDRSLLRFRPRHAIITNASTDHFPAQEAHALFDRFAQQVSGTVIDGRSGVPCPSASACDTWTQQFEWLGVVYRLPLPGRHNVCNAWHALRLALALGCDAASLCSGMAAFGGVERRLERVGVLAGAVVVDDYAHNPAKLRAVWETMAGQFERIVGLWRPHGYGPLRSMADELDAMFAEQLRPQDLLLILPVYDAGGTADRGLRADAFAARLVARGLPVAFVADLPRARRRMAAEARPGTVLATLGARDPELPRLARRLCEPVRQSGSPR